MIQMHYFRRLSENRLNLLGEAIAFVHSDAEKNSSRKLAVPKVATYRILTQLREYQGQITTPVAGCMRA